MITLNPKKSLLQEQSFGIIYPLDVVCILIIASKEEKIIPVGEKCFVLLTTAIICELFINYVKQRFFLIVFSEEEIKISLALNK